MNSSKWRGEGSRGIGKSLVWSKIGKLKQPVACGRRTLRAARGSAPSRPTGSRILPRVIEFARPKF
jgi:hypothetical protein